jgi:hypothetical protein
MPNAMSCGLFEELFFGRAEMGTEGAVVFVIVLEEGVLSRTLRLGAIFVRKLGLVLKVREGRRGRDEVGVRVLKLWHRGCAKPF